MELETFKLNFEEIPLEKYYGKFDLRWDVVGMMIACILGIVLGILLYYRKQIL